MLHGGPMSLRARDQVAVCLRPSSALPISFFEAQPTLGGPGDSALVRPLFQLGRLYQAKNPPA